MKRLTVLSISLFVGCAGCGRSGVEDLSPSRPEAPSARIETPADGVGEESAEVGSDRDAPAGGEEEHENHGNAGNPTAMLPLPTSMGRDSYCAMPHDGHSPNSTHHHPDDPDKRSEHQAAMALLLQDQATHVAIECGAWSNPETWEGGRIPDTDADVYIPLGVGVTYDLSAGPQLHYVMVEGFLEFATDRDTEIVLDSLIGAPSSHVHIGTPDEPVGAQYTARVEIADNGPIDTSRDPEELSRGLVLHGSVFIRGTSRTPHVELSNTPGSGTTSLNVKGEFYGWQVGDEVLIVGTHYNEGSLRRQGLRSQDERRSIRAIDGNRIELDRPLEYSHDVPLGYDFSVYLANITRNVEVASANPSGTRGHLMVMHSDQAFIRYASFVELGRTDKSRRFAETKPGRYPLHFHRAGTDPAKSMVVADGNVVIGAPGWGIVHHDSRAAVNRNVVFDVVGSGIVAEAGSEVGEWVGNLVTSVGAGTDSRPAAALATGSPKDVNFGPGSVGEAYTAMSRAVFQHGNIAANAQFGWVFEGRVGELTQSAAGGLAPHKEAFIFDPIPLHDWQNTIAGHKNQRGADADFMQFIDFRDNTGFALSTAIRSTHRGSWYRQHTALINEVVNFRAFRVRHGMDFANYSWDYTFRDCLLVGEGEGKGFSTFDKVENLNFINTRIVRFRIAVSYAYSNDKGVVLNLALEDNDQDIVNRGTSTNGSTALPLRVIREGGVSSISSPSFVLDSGSDLTLRPNLRRLSFNGTVTDRAGTYRFADYRHLNSSDWVVAENYTVEFSEDDGDGRWPVEELVSFHGALKRGDGSWEMPVAFWVGDRTTGKNHPIRIDFPLVDFPEAFLEANRIEEFTLPSADVEYLADILPL